MWYLGMTWICVSGPWTLIFNSRVDYLLLAPPSPPRTWYYEGIRLDWLHRAQAVGQTLWLGVSLRHVVCHCGKSFLECFRQSELQKDLGTIALYHGRADEGSLKSSVSEKASHLVFFLDFSAETLVPLVASRLFHSGPIFPTVVKELGLRYDGSLVPCHLGLKWLDGQEEVVEFGF